MPRFDYEVGVAESETRRYTETIDEIVEDYRAAAQRFIAAGDIESLQDQGKSVFAALHRAQRDLAGAIERVQAYAKAKFPHAAIDEVNEYLDDVHDKYLRSFGTDLRYEMRDDQKEATRTRSRLKGKRFRRR